MYDDRDSGEVRGWNSRWIQGGGRITSGINSGALLVSSDDGQVD